MADWRKKININSDFEHEWEQKETKANEIKFRRDLPWLKIEMKNREGV